MIEWIRGRCTSGYSRTDTMGAAGVRNELGRKKYRDQSYEAETKHD